MKKDYRESWLDEQQPVSLTGWGFRFKSSAGTFNTKDDTFSKWMKLFLQRLTPGRQIDVSQLDFDETGATRAKFIHALKRVSEQERIEITEKPSSTGEFIFYKNKPI